MTQQVADEVLGRVARQQHDLFRRVKEGTLDPVLVSRGLQDLIEGRNGSTAAYLKLISGGENLVIDAVDGTEVLANANDVFAGIDSDFVAYGADEPGLATPETPVRVYEMAKDATSAQMFGSLSGDLDTLCFTQAQIKGFVKKHRNWLRADGYATFFLFKSHNQFFVASVSVDSYGMLDVSVSRFGSSDVWRAGYRPQVVVL